MRTPESIRSQLDLPPDTRLIMASGEYVPGDGMRMAVWAFDVLKYVAPALHLVLVGDGHGRERVVRFARSLGTDDDRVHFLMDVHPLLAVAQADIAWGTHPWGGAAFLRAARACGVPVLAMRTPDTQDLREAVLSPLGDPVALAAATRKVLANLATPARNVERK